MQMGAARPASRGWSGEVAEVIARSPSWRLQLTRWAPPCGPGPTRGGDPLRAVRRRPRDLMTARFRCDRLPDEAHPHGDALDDCDDPVVVREVGRIEPREDLLRPGCVVHGER